MNKKIFDNIVTLTPNPAIDFMLVAENWQRGKVCHGDSAHAQAGGKGINVATGLALLNVQSEHNVKIVATGWLGKLNDTIFSEHLAENNIKDAFIRVSGQTRTNVKITDPKDNDTTDINFAGLEIPSMAQDELHALCQSNDLGKSIFVLAGSLPKGVNDSFYAKQIPILRNAGHTVILDANGKGLAAVVDSLAFPQIMKPNIHELRDVTSKALSSDEEIIALAKVWFKHGLELLVVSLGESGALFISESGVVRSMPPKISVSSTVGAGDAMVAGLTFSLISHFSLIETARFSTAVSVAKIGLFDDDLPLVERVEQLLPTVTAS